MNRIAIGLDLAKQVFQVHGVDEAGEVVRDSACNKDPVLECAPGGGQVGIEELTGLGARPGQGRDASPALASNKRRYGREGAYWRS
jgi:transposase